jgi:cytochrome c553
MRRRLCLLCVVVVATWSVISSIPRQLPTLENQLLAQTVGGRILADPIELTGENLTRHGQYLVHQVAMCVHCHSPHNNDGSLDERRLLAGAPVPLKSPFAKQEWAYQAPALAGLPGGWSEDQLARFLQTGETPNKHPARPPMPPYRLTQQDARAIAAYLRSLP